MLLKCYNLTNMLHFIYHHVAKNSMSSYILSLEWFILLIKWLWNATAMNVIKYSLCLKIRSTNTVVKTELTFPALRNTGTKLGSFFFLNEVLFFFKKFHKTEVFLHCNSKNAVLQKQHVYVTIFYSNENIKTNVRQSAEK